MKIEVFTVNPFQQNTCLLHNEGKALLFDAGFMNATELGAMDRFLKENGLELEAIILTHAHIDHILGLQMALSRHPVPVYMSHRDMFHWENYMSQAMRFGFQVQPFDFVPEELEDGGICNIGSFELDVRYTPGHAPEHVSIIDPDKKWTIAGDVLFQGSIGRTDLYKGDFELLAESIRTHLYTLPDETVVYPGHGPTTIIGNEKRTNPFVKP